jgi:hypothetical protein
MCIILLLPFHIDRLLVPFACIERGEGTYFVSETPDTLCSFEDARYAQMLMISAVGTGVMLGFYSMLILALWRSFVWQFGKSKVRSYIPFYVGMTQMSVFGQRGYMYAPRGRVMSNLAAVQCYDADLARFDLRMRLTKAAEHLGPRSRWVQEAAQARGIVLDTHVCSNDNEAGGEDEADTAKSRMEILKGADRWHHSRYKRPTHTDGNVMTYGWIVIVNMFWRQMLSLIVIKLSEGGLVVVGAAALMVLHAGNVTVLLIFKPYKSKKVSNCETIMLSALFLVLWCAVLKDLLSNHVNVHLFQDMVNRVNMGIDCLAVGIFLLVGGLPAALLYDMMKTAMAAFRSTDTLLNDIYMITVGKSERIKAEEEKEARIAELEDIAAERGLKLPEWMGKKQPTIRRCLEKINTHSDCHPSDDQRKRFRGMVGIIRQLPDIQAPEHKDDSEEEYMEDEGGCFTRNFNLSLDESGIGGASAKKLAKQGTVVEEYEFAAFRIGGDKQKKDEEAEKAPEKVARHTLFPMDAHEEESSEEEAEGPAWALSPLMALAAGGTMAKKVEDGTAVVLPDTGSVAGSFVSVRPEITGEGKE